MAGRKIVRFMTTVRTHSADGPGFKPLEKSTATPLDGRQITRAIVPWYITISSPSSETSGDSGNMYRAIPLETPLHPYLMGCMSGPDLRRDDSLQSTDDSLHELAFPDTGDTSIRLRLATHDVAVLRWEVNSEGNQPLSVLAVVESIRATMRYPILDGVVKPDHPLNDVVAAALRGRWGSTPRNMDLYGPADSLVLKRLVWASDASGVYYDVDLQPVSRPSSLQ